MPELPEVEQVRRSLLPDLYMSTVEGVDVHLMQQIASPFQQPNEFIENVQGAVITDLLRRGKYLIFVLSGGRYLVFHFRMTGKLLIKNREDLPDRHTHFVFYLSNGLSLFYHDVRKFGRLYLFDASPFDQPPLCHLGVEPLDECFNGDVLYKMLRGKKTCIKAALLDQHLIAGLGNIYVDEALFAARIRPRKKAERLSRRECSILSQTIKDILNRAIEAGGSSVRDYKDGHGQEGTYQQHHAVYGRSGKPCFVCGTTLKKVQVAGRSSVYCPTCQRS